MKGGMKELKGMGGGRGQSARPASTFLFLCDLWQLSCQSIVRPVKHAPSLPWWAASLPGIHTHTHTLTSIHTYAHAHTCMHAQHTCTRTHTHTHTHTHYTHATYVHTHTHTHTCYVYTLHALSHDGHVTILDHLNSHSSLLPVS